MLSKDEVIKKIYKFLKKHRSHKTHEITHIEKIKYGWFVVCYSEKFKYGGGYELIIDEEYDFIYGINTINNSLDKELSDFYKKRKNYFFRLHMKKIAPFLESIFLFFRII